MPATSHDPPPDPGPATSLDDVAECLRTLKVWAGNPSYGTIASRVNAGRPDSEQVGKTTVVDCFRAGRRRFDTDLVLAVVRALHEDPGYRDRWRQALRVAGRDGQAAAQVRVRDKLPPEMPGFTGRAAELDRLDAAVRRGRTDGGPVVISALAGMAGVGKTQLALRAAHRISRDEELDRILFVDLRGFDTEQPPADPAAVLDGFLRLLGLPGHRLPHSLEARAAAYRELLAGSRSLIVLDNAADERQVHPLLPGVPGCVTLITSRRDLAGLAGASGFEVDVFTRPEALEFLAAAAREVEVGGDPGAAGRIAERCGYLPLALALIAGQLGAKPGWTLTDHADRLDERHRDRRLDSGVELAFDVSYRNLPPGERKLLRLLAQHPGQDFDAYAAAALAGTDAGTAGARLDRLDADHLVQSAGPGRYGLHDLVRAYAGARSSDEDRRADRRAALIRLFDYYLATAAAVMNALDPVDATRRPDPPVSPVPPPDLSEPLIWLDAERPNLIAIAGHAADAGLTDHATGLSAVLFRYLAGGHHLDALLVHGHAARAARRAGDPVWLGRALAMQAVAEIQVGRHESAAVQLEQAWHLLEDNGEEAAAGRARNNLGIAVTRLGRYAEALEHAQAAVEINRKYGDRPGTARSLMNVGNVLSRLGREEEALGAYAESLALHRVTGDEVGEASALANIAQVEVKLRRWAQARAHVEPAIAMHARLGNVTNRAWALLALGEALAGAGDRAQADLRLGESLELFRQTGDRDGEACVLNGLGVAAAAAGDARVAAERHLEAYVIAVEISDREQQARAHLGLAHARRALGDPGAARELYRQAHAVFVELGSPEAGRIAEILAGL